MNLDPPWITTLKERFDAGLPEILEEFYMRRVSQQVRAEINAKLADHLDDVSQETGIEPDFHHLVEFEDVDGVINLNINRIRGCRP